MTAGLKYLTGANFRQGCEKSFAILDDQMQSLLFAGQVAIADLHRRCCRPRANKSNIENRISRHKMIPAKSFGNERQVEWKMRAHLKSTWGYDNPEDSGRLV